MRVLCYVEPTTFRNNPHQLQAWVGWLAQMMSAHAQFAPKDEFAIASAPWLCTAFAQYAPELRHTKYSILPRDILSPFGMDRHLYATDLMDDLELPIKATALYMWLDRIAMQFEPTVILSFTENRYLSQVFKSGLTLFAERAPLPQGLRVRSLFLDPSGHQRRSILARYAQRILSLHLTQEEVGSALGEWGRSYEIPMRSSPDTEAFLAWKHQYVGTNPLLLIALQQPDWLTFEGLAGRTPIDGQVMTWLAELPPNWRAVASYHQGFELPPSLEEAVRIQFPNLVSLPFAWRRARSEWLIPHVDAVVTVGSAVGMTGLLAGKKVVASLRSNLSGMAAGRVANLNEVCALSSPQRAALLAFLTHRYSHSMDNLLRVPGYFAELVDMLSVGDPIEAVLNIAGWHPSKIQDFILPEEVSIYSLGIKR